MIRIACAFAVGCLCGAVGLYLWLLFIATADPFNK